MLNLAIPFSRLFAGSLSYIWIFQIYLLMLGKSIEDLLSIFSTYKDFSLFFAFILIILSYPIGIVIQYFSYQLSDKILYQLFVYRKNVYNRIKHKNRLRKLYIKCSDRINNDLERKEQELSILGSCSINFLLISLVFLVAYKLDMIVIFSIVMMVNFFNMVIQKYKSWQNYVERIYNSLTE